MNNDRSEHEHIQYTHTQKCVCNYQEKARKTIAKSIHRLARR